MTTQLVRIAARFHGPPDSGNGGYVCGVVAGALGGSGCTVTLNRPPPLERDLELRFDGERVELFDGEQMIAWAVRGEPELDVPDPPPLEDARAAQRHYVGFASHNFPSCFVCGPERGEDGLRIFPGSVGLDRVASTWVPGDDLADATGMVRSEFLWAALDCPGYFAVEQAAGLAVLGRMTAAIEAQVRPGEPLIVTGWSLESGGRKHHVGTALHNGDGRRAARARSTWISISR